MEPAPTESTRDWLSRWLMGLCAQTATSELKFSEPPDRYPSIPGFAHAPMPCGSDTPQLQALIPDRTAVLAGPGSILVAHGPDEGISLSEREAGVELNRFLALHFLGGADPEPRKPKP